MAQLPMTPSVHRRQALRRELSRCAVSGTVVGTVASPMFSRALHILAASARDRAAFPCIATQFMSYENGSAHELGARMSGASQRGVSRDMNRVPADGSGGVRRASDATSIVNTLVDLGLIVALPTPREPLLPRPLWCGDLRYGWRRSHLYRSRMWRVVIETGYDLLAVDLDWHFTGGNPVAGLRAARMPAFGIANATAPAADEVCKRDPASGACWRRWDAPGPLAAVIAQVDPVQSLPGLLNVGLLWIRHGSQTRAFLRRVENRTFSAWEQGIFNEELQFGTDIPCCHPPPGYSCGFGRFFAQNGVVHGLGRADASTRKRRIRVEGGDRCRAYQPPTASPPTGTRMTWASATALGGASGWHPAAYNELRRRRIGRCTSPDAVCQGCGAGFTIAVT